MSEKNYTRRDYLKAMGLGLFSLMVPGCGRKSEEPQKSERPPNVVVFLTDEHWRSLW